MPMQKSLVAFTSFRYSGRDAAADAVAPDHFRNPILAGFYPDPSVCRVEQDYYLVNSTFAYYPGVPIFHSRDLVRWKQIGHVLDRASQLQIGPRAHTSGGIYAPTISFHEGVYRVVTTNVGGGGNFYVEATRPEGPWSEPIWLRDIHGIDPSFFFDDNGRCYVLNNGGPPDDKSLYDGHRAIWMQEMDFRAARSVGPRRIVVNGGVDLSKKPIWIEGPHLFKRDGWYLLHAAEGGTGPHHSQVVFRSRNVWGPYEPWSENPILTQRDLPRDRPDPVTCTGHADLVETDNGDWWAVFLGCRPDANGRELTGRETFLLPAEWIEGWPRILPPRTAVPPVALAPKLQPADATPPTTGSFDVVDDFRSPTMHHDWVMLRTPKETWHEVGEGSLRLQPRHPLWQRGNPSYFGRRLQHAQFTAEISVGISSMANGVDAGLVAFQNDEHHLFVGLGRDDANHVTAFVERVTRDADGKAKSERLAGQVFDASCRTVSIRISGDRMRFAVDVHVDGSHVPLLPSLDAGFLSTRTAGGFVGVTIGPHARLAHSD
jgi:xylan 1,4-beta-xylosidase